MHSVSWFIIQLFKHFIPAIFIYSIKYRLMKV